MKINHFALELMSNPLLACERCIVWLLFVFVCMFRSVANSFFACFGCCVLWCVRAGGEDLL
jgi:hypothetical protein